MCVKTVIDTLFNVHFSKYLLFNVFSSTLQRSHCLTSFVHHCTSTIHVHHIKVGLSLHLGLIYHLPLVGKEVATMSSIYSILYVFSSSCSSSWPSSSSSLIPCLQSLLLRTNVLGPLEPR